MGQRILTRDELFAFTPDAIELIYANIHAQLFSADIIEKTILQAMILSRIEQCKIDSEGLTFLLERIVANDDAVIFGPMDGELDSSRKSC